MCGVHNLDNVKRIEQFYRWTVFLFILFFAFTQYYY